MSKILKGLTESRNIRYPEDPDEYNAMFGGKRKSIDTRSDDESDYDPMDDLYRKQDKSKQEYNKQVKVDYLNKEGTAPNGERFNNIFYIQATSPLQIDNEIRKFKDSHWGAKQIVDVKKEDNTALVFIIDKHKHGYWKPWKDTESIEESTSIEKFQKVLEGIDKNQLADVLYNKLDSRYPDIVSNYGHEVVGDTIMNIVSNQRLNHETISTLNLNTLIKAIIKRLESSRNVSEEQRVHWYVSKDILDETSQISEKWSKKYKDSINCSNPKGFSQKAHCAGKKKNESAIMKGLKL